MYNLNKPIDKIIEDELKEKTQEEQVSEIRKSAQRIIAQREQEEESQKRRLAAIEEVKKQKGSYQKMLELAHDAKDTIRYSYAVIILSIIDNIDSVKEEMPLYEIEEAVPKSIPTDIDITEVERISKICPRFGGHSYIRIPVHDDVNLKNYTVCDLAGCLQMRLKNSTYGSFDLFA